MADGGGGVQELFIKFLPFSATEEKVRTHFAECKSLQSVRLSTNRETGECKGMGWMTIGDPTEAEWLVNEWNSEPFNEMDGRHMELTLSTAPSSWRARRPGHGTQLACRYGLSCSRQDCTFGHPADWDPKKTAGSTKDGESFAPSRIGCRYGKACKHPNCFFSHPEGRFYDGTCVEEKSYNVNKAHDKAHESLGRSSGNTVDRDAADGEAVAVPDTEVERASRVIPKQTPPAELDELVDKADEVPMRKKKKKVRIAQVEEAEATISQVPRKKKKRIAQAEEAEAEAPPEPRMKRKRKTAQVAEAEAETPAAPLKKKKKKRQAAE